MRRLAATTLALALLLTGCSSDGDSAESSPSSTSTSNSADVAALEAVTVEGDAGEEPTVTFDQPFTITAPVARIVSEGDGEDLVEGQIITMNYLALSGDDASVQQTTYGADTQQLTLGDANIVTELNEVLAGQKVGVRVLLAVPGSAATDTAEAVAATIMAIDVVGAKTIPARAEGEAVAPVEGLPTVTLADDGTPTITPATGTAPTTLVSQTLIKGSGAVVEAGQAVTVHYTGALWDGTVFDSSWGSAPFSATLDEGNLVDGWIQGLPGQTVGSQVLLVIPPELGYGDAEQSSIPAGSTLVFVVDILDAS